MNLRRHGQLLVSFEALTPKVGALRDRLAYSRGSPISGLKYRYYKRQMQKTKTFLCTLRPFKLKLSSEYDWKDQCKSPILTIAKVLKAF